MNGITPLDCNFYTSIKDFDGKQVALASVALVSSIALALFVHPAFWAASFGITTYALFKACYTTPDLTKPLSDEQNQLIEKLSTQQPDPISAQQNQLIETFSIRQLDPLSEEQKQLIEKLWPKQFDPLFKSLFEDTPYDFDKIPISPTKQDKFPELDKLSSPFLRVVLKNGWYAVVFKAISQAGVKTIMYIRVNPRENSMRFFSGSGTIFEGLLPINHDKSTALSDNDAAVKNITIFKELLNGKLVRRQSSPSSALDWKLHTGH